MPRTIPRSKNNRRSESGHALVYALVLIALATLSIAVVVLLASKPSGLAAPAVAAISALIAGVGLRHEYHRDLDAALTFSSVFLLLLAICTGIYVLSADRPGVIPKIATLLALLSSAYFGFLTYRRQTAPDSLEYPDLLRKRFSNATVFERDGVQFSAFLRPASEDQPHLATFVIQNSFDSPRKVSLLLAPGSASEAERLRFQRETIIQLGAAEVSQLSLPVVTPTYPGTYSLYFDISVSGSGGNRVRLRRAKVPERRITGGATVALLAVGVLAHGGGLKLTIGPLPSDIWSRPLPEPLVESLWGPVAKVAPIE